MSRSAEAKLSEQQAAAEAQEEATNNHQEASTAVLETAEQTDDHDTSETEVEAVDVAQSELSARKAEGAKFLAAFGDAGGKWFAEGLSFDEAQAKFIANLRDENEKLKQRLSGTRASDGESEPVDFSEKPKPKKKFFVRGKALGLPGDE
jgi:hypothetical protein